MFRNDLYRYLISFQIKKQSKISRRARHIDRLYLTNLATVAVRRADLVHPLALSNHSLALHRYSSSTGISRAYSISTRPLPTERRRKTALSERLGSETYAINR